MPKVSSKAQYRLFKSWVGSGRMSKAEFNKRTRGVDVSKLPARAGRKKVAKKRKPAAKKKTTKKGTKRKKAAPKRRKVTRRSATRRKKR